mmetsp:Transcript_48076/g.112371  ORF Transcript_48076/g.112371 Transcript_48076/m.112371 type:complete len:792 (-) Transcript_48076:82-2457(-)
MEVSITPEIYRDSTTGSPPRSGRSGPASDTTESTAASSIPAKSSPSAVHRHGPSLSTCCDGEVGATPSNGSGVPKRQRAAGSPPELVTTGSSMVQSPGDSPSVGVALFSPQTMVDLAPSKSIKRVPISGDRELQRELDGIQRTLADQKGDWKGRMKALQQLQGIVLASSESTTFSGRDFAQHTARIREPLVAQVQDLRSAIVREACSVLFLLAQVLGSDFEPFALAALPLLFKATFVAIAVIAESSFQCICAIVRECRTQRVLGGLVEQHNSRNGTLRLRCTQALLLALQTYPVHAVDKHVDAIEAVLRRALEDARDEVRAAGRQCFWVFQELYEERGTRLYGRLDGNKQKVLEEERPGKMRRDIGGLLGSPCSPAESPPTVNRATTLPDDKTGGASLQTPPNRRQSSPPCSGARVPSKEKAAKGAKVGESAPVPIRGGASASLPRREAVMSRPQRSSSKTQRNAAKAPQNDKGPHATASDEGFDIGSAQPKAEGVSQDGGKDQPAEVMYVPEQPFSPPPRTLVKGRCPDGAARTASTAVAKATVTETAKDLPASDISTKMSVEELVSGIAAPGRSTLRALALATRTEASATWERHFSRALLLVLDALECPEPQGLRETALLCLQEMVTYLPDHFVDFAEVVAAKLFDLCRSVPEDKRVMSAADRTLERVLGVVDPTRALEILLPALSTGSVPLLQAMRTLPLVLQRLQPDRVPVLLETLLPGVIKAMADESAEVRKGAVFCMVDMYFIVGDEVMAQLKKDLSASQLKLVLLYIGRQQRERDELSSSTQSA